MPGVVFSRGERVTLRTVEREDVDVLQRALNEPAFQRGFLLESPRNREMVEERVEDTVEADDDSVYLLVSVDGDAVGGVSLREVRPHQDHGMLAYWLLPRERGHGYATEGAALLVDHAFEQVGLHRVYAWTIADNEASRALLERLGFAHEGTYREHVFTRGRYRDTEHYGLLASEWDGVDAVLDGS